LLQHERAEPRLGVDQSFPPEHAQGLERRDLGDAVGIAELDDGRQFLARPESAADDLLPQVGSNPLGRPVRLYGFGSGTSGGYGFLGHDKAGVVWCGLVCSGLP